MGVVHAETPHAGDKAVSRGIHAEQVIQLHFRVLAESGSANDGIPLQPVRDEEYHAICEHLHVAPPVEILWSKGNAPAAPVADSREGFRPGDEILVEHVENGAAGSSAQQERHRTKSAH